LPLRAPNNLIKLNHYGRGAHAAVLSNSHYPPKLHLAATFPLRDKKLMLYSIKKLEEKDPHIEVHKN
jgi:hypothetical protein